MFFYEGCKQVGQLDLALIEKARDFALTIDYTAKRFTREEPALRYSNYLVSLTAPYVDSSAYEQDNSDLDFSSVDAILKELKTWNQFKNMTVFSCEISYLTPGQELRRHNDVRFYHLCGRRIQVPLLVDNSYFISRERPFKLETPNVYEIDNITLHYAKNKSTTTPKISLLIDFLDTQQLAEERAMRRHPRRRVLYYNNTTPENDTYGTKTTGKIIL
jgi:hypothetical protein